MASYTMQLRTYIEQQSQNDDDLSMREKIEVGREKLFDFDYPMFDPNYKKIFETNLIRKFYMREIGFETEGLFKFHLETWLNINMPYFNRLFESEMIKYDPLINSEMNVTHEQVNQKDEGIDRDTTQHTTGQSKDQGKGESETDQTNEKRNHGNDRFRGNTWDTDFNRNISTDTPDNRLAITTKDGKGVIEYASKIDEQSKKDRQERSDANAWTENTDDDLDVKNKSEYESVNDIENDVLSNDNISTQMNEVEDFIQHRTGKIGVVSYSDLVIKYRNSFLRIENMIHKEMQELFMLVY